MDNYNGNSNASKNKKSFTAVELKGSSSTTGEGKKFFKSIIANDGKTTFNYILSNHIIPSITNFLVDTSTAAIRYLFKGDSKPSTTSRGYGNVSYNTYYTSPAKTQTQPSGQYGSVTNVNDNAFNVREDAEVILAILNDMVSRYAIISVADFYEVWKECAKDDTDVQRIKVDYTANNYGWRSLEKACVVRDGSIFRIKFPKVEPLT